MNTKRAAIQLSMSFLVMLIIAIVIFMLSLVFLGDFFQQATELKTALDTQTQSQIESMLAGNARVAIPLETQKTKRGESVSYGVGIKNTLSGAAAKEHFIVEIDSKGVFIPIQDPEVDYEFTCAAGICELPPIAENAKFDTSKGEEIRYAIGRNGQLNIPINQDDAVIIALQAVDHAPRGHYIFNVEVCADDATGGTCTRDKFYDDTLYKIHLIVS